MTGWYMCAARDSNPDPADNNQRHYLAEDTRLQVTVIGADNLPVSPEQNKAVVQLFYDQWTAGSIDFDLLVHPDITNHQPDSDEKGLENSVRR